MNNIINLRPRPDERAASMARHPSGQTPSGRKAVALRRLTVAGAAGMTWREFDSIAGINHHGKSTAALSMLHKEGKIARLTERRDGCAVYVALVHVDGRATEKQGARQSLVDEMATVLRALVRDGCEWHRDRAPVSDCAACKGARLVRIYESRNK